MTVKELISKLRKVLKEDGDLQVGVNMEDGWVAVITNIAGVYTISQEGEQIVILNTDITS